MGLRKIIIAIILVALIGGIASGIAILSVWNTPLGPVLNLPAQSSGLASTTASSGSEAQEPDLSIESPSLISRVLKLFRKQPTTGEPLCNGPSVMTILLIGSDERSNDYLYGLADSIRLIRIDFITPGIMILDIPRDLWVEIPDIKDHYEITHGKLNQAYLFGNPGMGYYDGPDKGPGLLARTLDVNFGVRVDHYLAVDMTTFVDAIDAVGGIDIQLESTINLNMTEAVQDPKLILGPGNHHLNGEMALKMAVNRNISIFQRARYQNIVLGALRDKLLSPSIILKLPQLITQFSRSVQTDLSPSDINHLLCIGQEMSKDNTTIVAFPEDMFTSESTYDPYRKVNTYTLGADFEKLRSYFTDFMNGTWP